MPTFPRSGERASTTPTSRGRTARASSDTMTVTFTPTGSGVQANKTVELYWGLRLAKPGDYPSAAPARQAWPGASLQLGRPRRSSARGRDDARRRRVHANQPASESPCAARSAVSKFSDLDGDGAQGAGEPGLTNWTINLCSDSACATVVETATTTGSDGAYSFSVTPGSVLRPRSPAVRLEPDRSVRRLLRAHQHHCRRPDGDRPEIRQPATRLLGPCEVPDGRTWRVHRPVPHRLRLHGYGLRWLQKRGCGRVLDRLRDTGGHDLHGHGDHVPDASEWLFVRSRHVLGYLRHHEQ